MIYDDNRDESRDPQEGSQPGKRKRISAGKPEPIRSSDDARGGQPLYSSDKTFKKPYSSDREVDGNSYTPRSYNRDGGGERNYNRDQGGYRRDSADSGDRNYNRNDRDRSSGGYSRGGDRNQGYDRSSGGYNRGGDRDSGYSRGNSGYNRDGGGYRSSGSSGNDRGGYGDRNYNSDRNFNRSDNNERGGYSRGGDRSFNRSSDSGRGGDRSFTKKSYGGGSSQHQGGFQKSYGGGGDRRSQGQYGDRNRKPFQKREAPQRQPEYHFDEEAPNAPIRLNKYIANTGLCSRREADEYIQAGLITVNGQLVTELGVKVMPTDEVRYNNERLQTEKKVYILLNKPKDYVTSVDDPHAKRTVMDLIKGACRERIYPVGRLDRMTTGVLLLTNDGELTKKLTHPVSNIKKIYQVHLDKNIKADDLQAISEGIVLDDGFIQPDMVDYVYPDDHSTIGVEIHSGRNRIVRRIFEYFGYKVIKLDRVYFAGLTKKSLQRGHWRYLDPKEVGFLKMLQV
jgi:23S rRNA pseudouridine2605 synthase